jgi:hypothetical protein
VGHADADGRATVKLPAGSHEIRATAPTGATATRLVSVSPQVTGSLKTVSFPLAETRLVEATTSVSRPEQPRRGKQIAAAAAVILLLALAAVAYFVLRGPDRTREQITSASAAPVAPTSSSVEPATKPTETSDNQQVSDDKKKAAEAKRQTDQNAAVAEAQKKAIESKEKNEKKETSPPSVPEPNPKPAVPAPPAEPPTERPNAPRRDGCMLVTVLDANGQVVQGARVMVEGTTLRGRTGPKGHWQDCGLQVGQSIRVLVMGPMGARVGSQTAVVAPRTLVTVRLDRPVNRGPAEPQPLNPARKRPFPGRP